MSAASELPDRIIKHEQVITISYDNKLTVAERRIAHRWLEQVTDALLTVYGELPEDDFGITIKHSTNRSSPVPWGHVERGDPANILLVINPAFGYDELISDWTAFHELSHLLLPYRGYGDIWLSEGLATYYQNIIQARSGLLDETWMWRKIAAGFERGLNDQQWRQLNLTEVSDNLGETRQYMRVHWSGVLFWLSADVALREQHGNSLDELLQQLNDCCAGRTMSAEAIVEKLDELANTELFVTLFREYRLSHSIPDYKPALAHLGIEQRKLSNAITLSDNAPGSQIRKQIYHGSGAAN
jgi:hypothetical protein